MCMAVYTIFELVSLDQNMPMALFMHDLSFIVLGMESFQSLQRVRQNGVILLITRLQAAQLCIYGLSQHYLIDGLMK